MSEALRIHYHRDFDGMVSAAVLAEILREVRGEQRLTWSSVNYDQRKDWDDFSRGERFAIVDFHFHPRAEYWFDHHPTTFLAPELRAQYRPTERWRWDPGSPSCPPLILRLIARCPALQRLPGRLIGLGLRPEHVQSPGVPAGGRNV